MTPNTDPTLRPEHQYLARGQTMTIPAFRLGQPVSKSGGDYRFDGVVVAVFVKLSMALRYVVEDDRGCLHVFSESNLTARKEHADE